VVDETVQSSPESEAEARDAAAFPRIVSAHHDDMARVAFVVIGLPRPAQDAVEAAWVKVWHERASLQTPKRLRAWLLGIAAKEARELAEGGFGQSVDRQDSGAPVSQAASAPPSRSDELALANALSTLDAYDRMILGLRWVGDLDAEQIAVELGMPANAVLARVARILDAWLKDASFAAPPDVTLDEYEHDLALRLRSLADRAIVEIDADAIAKTAIESVPAPGISDQLDATLAGLVERVRAVDRRIWAIAGGVVAVLIAFSLLGGGGGGVALATPVPTDATRLCLLGELEARVTGWQATGDERIATVAVQNTSNGACLLDGAPEPWLIDGTQTAILKGQDLPAGGVRIGPHETLRTRVHVANYCGRQAQAPVTVGFREGTTLIIASPLDGNDTSGVPPCTSNGAATLYMEAWGT
jgi:RNA polymerase sigma-70 factor (ECF subfamily)